MAGPLVSVYVGSIGNKQSNYKLVEFWPLWPPRPNVLMHPVWSSGNLIFISDASAGVCRASHDGAASVRDWLSDRDLVHLDSR
jgi:hypothetical protein